jgi:integrase
MATITHRGPYQWQATVRKKGYRSQSETFETKLKAEEWSKVVESETVRGVFADRAELERTTLADLIEKYRVDVSPNKLSCRTELVTARRFLRHPLALRPLATVRSVDFARYRDERLAEKASPNSVRLELTYLSTMFTTARKELSIQVENFLEDVRKPSAPLGRQRRLVGDEEARLLTAVRDSDAQAFELCFVLSIETGMRAGNIVKLCWEDIDFEQHLIFLEKTKNGDSLSIPLSEAAEAMLKSYPCADKTGGIARFYDSAGLGAAFRVACKKAGIPGLRYHDLRHDAATRLAPLVEAPVLAKLMGWKTLQMAMRYYNPTEEELVKARREAEAVRNRNLASSAAVVKFALSSTAHS